MSAFWVDLFCFAHHDTQENLTEALMALFWTKNRDHKR